MRQRLEIPDHDELWRNVIAKVDEIMKEYNGKHQGSSREAASTDIFGQSISTILDITDLDGTHRVFRVTALKEQTRAQDVKVKVDRWFHNGEDFWEPMITNPDAVARRVVIDHVHYMLGANGARSHPRNGFAGRRHVIEFFDGRHVVTHDLWYQGPIPPVFWDRLPDNAKWGSDNGEED